MKALVLVIVIVALGTGIPEAEARPKVQVTKTVVTRQAVVRVAPASNVIARIVSRNIRQSLSENHVRVAHGDHIYYVDNGVYYIHGPRGYTVTTPVSGVQVSSLPRGYVTLQRSGQVYYRYNGINYRRRNGFYIVV